MFKSLKGFVRKIFWAAALAVTGFAAAHAAQPTDWQIWHQEPATGNMEAIVAFDWWTLYFIVPITLFVLGLLAWVLIRYSAKANPVPGKVTHNTTIEIIWTVVPVIILVAIAIPSFQLLTRQVVPDQEPDLVVKATGYQWYWGYEYQDGSEIAFEQRLIGRDDGTPEGVTKASAERDSLGKTDLSQYPRLLAVDNELVVPVGKMVQVLVTAEDVIHNFAMPAFGLKMDAIPGRLNQTWFKAEREGLYYGQCSELCGRDHAFMPIGIRVVSEAQFETWKEAAKNGVGEANKQLMAAIEAAKKPVDVAKK